MTRELADKIIADTPEFKRLAEELERAGDEFRANPSKAGAERWNAAVVAFGAQCSKINAYLGPALEAMQAIAPRRRKRGKARR